MASLYAIADDILGILIREDDDGSLEVGTAERLDALQVDLETKVDNVCRFIQQMKLDAVAYKAEADRLAVLSKRAEAKADYLKEYVRSQLERLEIKRIDTLLFKVRRQANSRPSISLAEGAPIPDEYQRVKVEFDGTKAYEAFKNGATLPPELIVKHGEHLRIQ